MLEQYINKITCGDSYELIKQIPDKSIDLIYIDIPYDFDGNGGGGVFGSKKRDYHKEYEKVSENTNATGLDKRKTKSNNECESIAFGIDFTILDEFIRTMKAINIYIWCSKKQILPLMNYFVGGYSCSWDLLTWHKTNPIPTCNGTYLCDTEYCLLFRDKDGKAKIYGSYETKSKYWISGTNTYDKDKYFHPTIKPIEFVKNHIINSTQENDIVADFFCGSGTTCLAAKELNRQYIGFEISEKWAKIAQDRLNGIDGHGQISLGV